MEQYFWQLSQAAGRFYLFLSGKEKNKAKKKKIFIQRGNLAVQTPYIEEYKVKEHAKGNWLEEIMNKSMTTNMWHMIPGVQM